ncbi:MAG: SAM-dependent methyltransferase [Chlamydiales bacterium]|nr:SAM-dependent methyltransferase [Chlamydiales bacterium]
MLKSGLILLPNLLGEGLSHESFFPKAVDQAVGMLDGLIAESMQGGRSYLNQFRTKKPPYDIPIGILDENTRDDEIDFLLQPLKEGELWGLVSDAGLPCIADPGARVVFRARQLGIKIETLTGPSAVIMAIQLSGLPGQRFSFLGYLSKDLEKREKELKALEKRSKEERSLQVFMEAPYRNKYTFEAMLEVLHPSTYVGIACDLSLETERIMVQKVETFKKSPLPNIDKKPCIFLVYA